MKDGEVGLASSAQVTAVGEERPHGPKTLTVARSIGDDAIVLLEEGNNLLKEAVDFRLIGARSEGVMVIDAGKLRDPDGLAVLHVMANVLLDPLQRVLVDVNVGDIPVSSARIQEGLKPILVVLLAHGGRAQGGTLAGKRGDIVVPLGGSNGRVLDIGRHGAVAVRLVESHHDLRGIV